MLGAAKRHSTGQRGGIFRGFLSATGSFIKTYFLRGAILDGGPGFLYCLFVALESFFRYVALEYDKHHLSESIQR
jgi:hypothetical protein